MPRSVTPVERYFRIAEDTKSYKFDTLARARDFLKGIHLLQRTLRISQALAKLNSVVDGRHDAPVLAEAFHRLKNIDANTPAELAEAEKVLRTIRFDDPKFREALAARRGFSFCRELPDDPPLRAASPNFGMLSRRSA